MFGALGKAKKTTSVTFTSQLALDDGLQDKLNIDKKESKQKILIYSASIAAAAIVLFLIF